MTAETQSSGGTDKLYLYLSGLACLFLGMIALYSSGVGLVEPKFHRAAGFALALVAGLAAARSRRVANGDTLAPKERWVLAIDFALLVAA